MKLVSKMLVAMALVSGTSFAGDEAWQAACVAAEQADPGAGDANSAGGTNVQQFCKCMDDKTPETTPAYDAFKASGDYKPLEDACARQVGWN